MITIYCQNTHTDIPARGGETLLQLLQRVQLPLPFTPICALVNNKNESLQYPLYSPKQVEYVSAESASGRRVYVRSLCMMLYRAVVALLPGARLVIAHSVARGYYCRLEGMQGRTIDDSLLRDLKGEMMRLVKANLPFERHERPTHEVIEMFRAQGLHDKVLLLSTLSELYTVYYTLDGVADSYNSCLAPATGMLGVFDLIPYEEGFLMLGPDSESGSRAATPVEQEKMYRAFTDYIAFNRIVGVTNAGELNRAVEAGRSSLVINVAEALHEKRIANISDTITRRYHEGGARVVLIAGPSSSGKTTFTKRLAIQLMTNLIKPLMISLDDYFVDRHLTPVDEHGEYDYESLHALDVDLFNEHLNELIAGGEVELPSYRFDTGRSVKSGRRIALGEKSILLIEGIHGLNPELTAAVEAFMKYRVYVSALTTIAIDDHNWVPTTDNRLLRRIIRDLKYRGTSPVDTIKRWPSVRRGEEKWIFPFQENADAMFNSSLLYEMSVMREQAERALHTVPRNVEQYSEAVRLRRFLNCFKSIDPAMIPSTSLLREFLGGSSFHY